MLAALDCGWGCFHRGDCRGRLGAAGSFPVQLQLLQMNVWAYGKGFSSQASVGDRAGKKLCNRAEAGEGVIETSRRS